MTSTRIAAHAVARALDANAFAIALTLSVGVHYGLLSWAPNIRVGELNWTTEELRMVDVPPPAVELPPVPERIARPATPVVSSAAIDQDITIAPTTFEANPVESLPPPPSTIPKDAEDIRAAPTFTPYTVRPELRNPDEIRRALEAAYPPLLRDAGIGGRVLVWVFINEDGVVEKALVKEGAGSPAFDEVALAVTPRMHFSPAINRDRRVAVWIELPLVFTTR
jgi:periplasmic protein TonB